MVFELLGQLALALVERGGQCVELFLERGQSLSLVRVQAPCRVFIVFGALAAFFTPEGFLLLFFKFLNLCFQRLILDRQLLELLLLFVALLLFLGSLLGLLSNNLQLVCHGTLDLLL